MSILRGRTVLISGASSGLGAHFARLCARHGANVVLGARRLDKVNELARQIGDTALPVLLDVTSEESVIAAYDAAQSRFGCVDTIIANAGVSGAGASTDMPLTDLRMLVDTNIVGAFLTVREGARRMLAMRLAEGRVVVVGSISASLTGGGITAYAATKAAVSHLGRNLAREWVRKGINVNVIQPGYIETELSGGWFQSDRGKAQIETFHRRRLQPIESLDEMLVYLCSDAAGGMTGAVIDIDDGQAL